MIIENIRHKTFPVKSPAIIKKKVLSWLKQFNTFCFLDSNQYQLREKKYEVLIGAGEVRSFQSSATTALQDFQKFMDEKPAWLFGHLAYDLQTIEHSKPGLKNDCLHFPDVYFFQPQIILHLKETVIEITSTNPDDVFKEIQNTGFYVDDIAVAQCRVQNRISKEEYVSIIEKLQQHIHRGDCYEINFCQEFFAENILADPFYLYERLSAISPNPFSAFYRLQDKWLLCASPERFLQKQNNIIISQPIKGTLPRNKIAEGAIGNERKQLLNSAKDKAENVMVVDLVRNDLSRICKEGTVNVDELFGVYTFPQVHQMISTVSGQLCDGINFSGIINATFPMGSMTGAPKIKVMELIAQYEKSKRGLFSGTVGYIDPEGNFDLNVVIRSLMHNHTTKYISFQAGSGITIYSDAEEEWEECMIKAKAIKEILGDVN